MTTTVFPCSTKPAQHLEQAAGVLEVQSGRGLVEDVEGVPGRAAAQLAGQLHPLGLAARERGCRLAQAHVAQPDVDQCLHVTGDRRLALEEGQRLLTRHVEHVGDRLAPEGDLERVAVVARAVADLAGHVDVGQEVHLDLDGPVARAGLAATAAHVEGEAAGLVPAHLGFGRLGEELADVVEDAGVGGGVRARRATDGRLVDVDHLVEVLHTLDLAVPSRQRLGPVQLLGQ